MLENPELLGEMVRRSGAHSTDMQQPESTDDVFRRCRPYADQWTPSLTAFGRGAPRLRFLRQLFRLRIQVKSHK